MGTEKSASIGLVRARSRERISVELEPGARCALGRGGDCEARVAAEGVAERHLELLFDGSTVSLRPLAGAPVGVNGHAVAESARLEDGDWLAVGSTLFQVSLGGAAAARVETQVPGAPRTDPAPEARGDSAGQEIRVGRSPESDICIDSPIVSRHHARLVRGASGFSIQDLRSTNGTFVNGERVDRELALHGGERVEFGSFAYLFDGESLRELAGAGSIRIDVRGLGQVVPDVATGAPRALLSGIDLSILPGEFVGVFGTSGSGKSTLLDALNGRRPASGGSVRYNDTDLYGSFDLFRATIGYVPQQDIVHRRIRVRDALGYAARLRLPPDTSASEIDEHLLRVLGRVALREQIDQPIDTPSPLSGGQLKRVSVAVELVSNPSVLFLDEATSGLDAGTDRRLMTLFAELARDGKTVVCVTHTLENVDACDLVVLLHRGRLVYFGPPEEALEHFGIERLAQVYDRLEAEPPEHWADRYDRSPWRKRYIDDRLGASADSGPRKRDVPSAPRGPRLDVRQGWILMRRYLDLLWADRRALWMLLAPAPAIGLLIGYVWGGSESPLQRAASEAQASFTLVLSMLWLGCFNGAREIVKELSVFRRERAVNLGLLPYVTSKLGPLSLLCAVQSLAMLGLAAPLSGLSGSLPAQALVLFSAGMVGTAMGLAVSALVDSNDKAAATVPLLLVPQLIFSNVFELPATAKLLAQLAIPAFWGFDAMKAALGTEVRDVIDPFTRLPVVGVEATLGLDVAVLGIFFGVFLAVVFLGLQLGERRR